MVTWKRIEQGLATPEVVGLAAIMFFGLLIRILVWNQLGSLSWDEGSHALAGIGLSRYLFNASQLQSFFSHYWAATGSLFFYPWGYSLLVVPSYWLFGVSE